MSQRVSVMQHARSPGPPQELTAWQVLLDELPKKTASPEPPQAQLPVHPATSTSPDEQAPVDRRSVLATQQPRCPGPPHAVCAAAGDGSSVSSRPAASPRSRRADVLVIYAFLESRFVFLGDTRKAI